MGSQRRHVVILFCDLCGSTRIAALMEPEDYAELIQHLRDLFAEIVARHGGEIARIDGDGALCIFGYPESHEDAGRRATEAAIDLHAAAATLDQRFAGSGAPIRLHSGIHAGTVLLSEGDMVRGRFEILGDATNVAARLCDHAQSDEIIVSEATLGADRHFFRSGPRRNLSVTDHARVIAVVDIYGREPVTTRFAARTLQGLTPFAGRTTERALLRAWLADAHAGPMLIAGPPGIGKSRLLGEFLGEAQAAGVAIHRGYCEAYLGASPLQPFTQLARSILGDQGFDLPRIADTRATLSAIELGLDRTLEAMRVLIERATEAGRCILAIDDWQWADDASRELLDALVADAPHCRFLLASRETDARLSGGGRPQLIEVPPLAAREAQQTIASLLATPDPFLASRIGEESGGSPLYIEELCHASHRGGDEMERTQRNAWVDMMIQARFAQLLPDQASLVRAASIIGHMVPTWLFSALTGVEANDPAIAGLAEADFLFPGDVPGTLRFKHGITRDAIYQAIGLKERRALHHRVVEVLKDEAGRSGEQSQLDALAYHCAAAGDGIQAVPYAIRAGDAALAAGALDRAQAQYRLAFETVAAQGDGGPHADQVWPLVNKYGLACIVDPAPDQLPVIREMTRRLRTLGNVRALVRSEYWLGAIAYGLGEGKQSVAYLTSALRSAIQLGQGRFIAQIEIKLAQSLFAAGRYSEADALFARLLDAGERAMGIDEETFVYALCCHGFLHADRGDFGAANKSYAAAEQVLGSAAPPLLASCLTQKSAVCLYRGEWHAALAQARECLDLCGRTRARYQAMMSNALGAYAQWQIDRDPRAVETLVGAGRWFETGASRQRTSLVHGWLADVMAETGRTALARHYTAQAIARVRRAGDRLGEAMAYRALARVATDQRNRRGAERYLAAAYRSAALRGSRREDAQTRLLEAGLALELGDRARAELLLTEARAAFVQMDMPHFAERAGAMLATNR